MSYTELDWREAILLGAALRDGLVGAVADGPRPAVQVARGLCLDGRAVFVVLSALAELGILEEAAGGYRLGEEHRALFARMRGAHASGGLPVIREFVRGVSEEAALSAANMLVLTRRGGTYAVEEYEEWLRGAGFREAKISPVPGRKTHLILARNPG